MNAKLLFLSLLPILMSACGPGLSTRNNSDPTGQASSQCSDAFMEDLNQVLVGKAKYDQNLDPKNLKSACTRFDKRHHGEICQLNDGGKSHSLNDGEIQKICQLNNPTNPTESESPAVLVRDLKELNLTVTDRALANRVLFQKSDKINAALVDGTPTPAENLMSFLKGGKTVCLFLGSVSQFPESSQVLRASKISEKSTHNSGFATLLHAEILLSWKDQLYSLHCEKNSFISTSDIQSSLGSSFAVSSRLQ